MADKSIVADKNRRIRKEALREQLAAGGHLQHVIDIAEKLSNEAVELDAIMVQRMKSAADIKLRLVSKYLPDLKAIEITGEDGDAIKVTSISVAASPQEAAEAYARIMRG